MKNKLIKNLLPGGIFSKKILQLALPAIAGLSTQMILSLVDTAFVGRLSNPHYALAAMGIGILATWAIVSFFSSLSTGTHVLVARKFGEKDFKSCGIVLKISLIIGFIIGIAVTLLIVFFSPYFSDFLAKNKIVAELSAQFMKYRFLGLPFFLMSVAFRGFYFGIGNTKIFMVSAVITNIVNLFFSYIFIFGKFGIPPLGLAGAGLSSSIATFTEAMFYFLVTLFSEIKFKYSLLEKFKFDFSIIKSIYKISLPISFQSVFIMIGFLIFVSITGIIGVEEQAISQIVISTLFISFIPSFGFGIAVQTLVGNQIGKNKKFLAKIYGFETAKLATYYTFFLGLIYIFFPRVLLILITNDYNLIEMAKPVMRVVGFAQMFYAMGVVFSNGIQAMGKTRFVMRIEIISNLLIFVPLSYLLSIQFKLGLLGAWFALPIYVIIYTTLMYLKFNNHKSWQFLKI